MEIILNAKHLSFVSHAMSAEESRYYLRGVNVEIAPYSVTMCATDGSMLLAANHAREEKIIDETISLIIPSEVIKRIRINKKQDDLRLIRRYDDIWQLEDELFTPIDGTFPKWRYIFSKGKINSDDINIKDIWFNPKYLMAIQKAADVIHAAYYIFPNNINPALLSFHERNDVFGALMPMASYRPKSVNAPDWCKE